MAKKISGIDEHWTAFIICILVHMLLPLLPLFIEWLLIDKISNSSYTITIAIYAMTIGASSTNSIIAILCIFIGIIFSVLYGATVSNPKLVFDIQLWSIMALITIFVPHALERYNRHVYEKQAFKIFGQK
ncbi:hypothetical protein KTH76_02220 [Acinetobacter baumannii]|uniref:Uncharacterized protein n=1 Tax=Acinetobacter calcoaceticus DSM 30006 = CIP 81.8 TaxID=981331 RepID=A0ABN0K6C4_ACICA|nr:MULTISPECIES: hypothetical protein [Acinetobacter calcoaceticus/baumannii complex]EKT8144760.1 hypothetical protein [Acinetobacter baumannii]EKU7085421.1 hypothetical protein [Acinetobacter baumannii]EKV1042086.1 hypothetical protein [Acinetobacter baumannii]EKV1046874.1 hypothetical protein [Acinetobacter baumannii]EKV1920637.1 hypothetical protein [Acinetobacter baumannii]